MVDLKDLSPKEFDALMKRLDRIKASYPLDHSHEIPTRIIPPEIDSVLQSASFLRIRRQQSTRDHTPIEERFMVDMTAIDIHPIK